MKLNRALFFALLLAGSLPSAMAEGAGGAGGATEVRRTRGLPDAVKPYDVDGNGKLSREEYRSYVEGTKPGQPQNVWDVNQDGILSAEEIAAARAVVHQQIKERVLKRFSEADLDDDNFLTQEELSKILPRRYDAPAIEKIFARIDVDADGKISAEEFLRILAVPPAGPK